MLFEAMSGLASTYPKMHSFQLAMCLMFMLWPISLGMELIISLLLTLVFLLVLLIRGELF